MKYSAKTKPGMGDPYWFEHYCGSRSDMGNRYHSNQPYMQRWIVQKEKLNKSMREAGIPHSVESVVDFSIRDYE